MDGSYACYGAPVWAYQAANVVTNMPISEQRSPQAFADPMLSPRSQGQHPSASGYIPYEAPFVASLTFITPALTGPQGQMTAPIMMPPNVGLPYSPQYEASMSYGGDTLYDQAAWYAEMNGANPNAIDAATYNISGVVPIVISPSASGSGGGASSLQLNMPPPLTAIAAATAAMAAAAALSPRYTPSVVARPHSHSGSIGSDSLTVPTPTSTPRPTPAPTPTPGLPFVPRIKESGLLSKTAVERLARSAPYWVAATHYSLNGPMGPSLVVLTSDKLVAAYGNRRVQGHTLLVGLTAPPPSPLPPPPRSQQAAAASTLTPPANLPRSSASSASSTTSSSTPTPAATSSHSAYATSQAVVLPPAFLRPLVYYLAHVLAGMLYTPITLEQLAAGAPPAGWCIPGSLFQPQTTGTGAAAASAASSSSSAAAAVTVNGNSHAISGNVSAVHRWSVDAVDAAVRSLLATAPYWCLLRMYDERGRWSCPPNLSPMDILRQLRTTGDDGGGSNTLKCLSACVVGTKERLPPGVWIPTSMVLPLGVLLQILATHPDLRYTPPSAQDVQHYVEDAIRAVQGRPESAVRLAAHLVAAAGGGAAGGTAAADPLAPPSPAGGPPKSLGLGNTAAIGPVLGAGLRFRQGGGSLDPGAVEFVPGGARATRPTGGSGGGSLRIGSDMAAGGSTAEQVVPGRSEPGGAAAVSAASVGSNDVANDAAMAVEMTAGEVGVVEVGPGGRGGSRDEATAPAAVEGKEEGGSGVDPGAAQVEVEKATTSASTSTPQKPRMSYAQVAAAAAGTAQKAAAAARVEAVEAAAAVVVAGRDRTAEGDSLAVGGGWGGGGGGAGSRHAARDLAPQPVGMWSLPSTGGPGPVAPVSAADTASDGGGGDDGGEGAVSVASRSQSAVPSAPLPLPPPPALPPPAVTAVGGAQGVPIPVPVPVAFTAPTGAQVPIPVPVQAALEAPAPPRSYAPVVVVARPLPHHPPPHQLNKPPLNMTHPPPAVLAPSPHPHLHLHPHMLPLHALHPTYPQPPMALAFASQQQQQEGSIASMEHQQQLQQTSRVPDPRGVCAAPTQSTAGSYPQDEAHNQMFPSAPQPPPPTTTVLVPLQQPPQQQPQRPKQQLAAGNALVPIPTPFKRYETAVFRLFQGDQGQHAFTALWWYVDPVAPLSHTAAQLLPATDTAAAGNLEMGAATAGGNGGQPPQPPSAASATGPVDVSAPGGGLPVYVLGPYSCEQMILAYIAQLLPSNALVCGTAGSQAPPSGPPPYAAFLPLASLLAAIEEGRSYRLLNPSQPPPQPTLQQPQHGAQPPQPVSDPQNSRGQQLQQLRHMVQEQRLQQVERREGLAGGGQVGSSGQVGDVGGSLQQRQ